MPKNWSIYNSFNDAIEYLCSVVESEIKHQNLLFMMNDNNRYSSNDKLSNDY